jgi:hypothetical protein
MAGMTFSEVFANYYTRYRGDSDVPGTTDPEWAIAIQLYNTAVRRWEHVDGVKWNELWTNTTAFPSGAALTFTAGKYAAGTGYTCPTIMAEPGGYITLTGGGNAQFNVPIVSPEDVQVQNPQGPFAYFTGNRHTGYTLFINVGGADSAYNSYTISYPYYAKANYLLTTEDGTSIIQCPDPEFLIDTMVAQRFLESRNFPAYQVFDRDATQALANLEVRNSAGTPHNAWQINDTGAGWGLGSGQNGSFFS